MKTIRIMISGRVQGVGYRAWFRDQAERLRCSGWVRNRRDGTVEVLVSGEGECIRQLVEAAARGPAMAEVDSVVCGDGLREEVADGRMEIRPTL